MGGKATEIIDDLVLMLRNGADFYRDAARRLTDPALIAICEKHADLRDRATVELTSLVNDAGTEIATPGLRDRVDRWLVQLRSTFSEMVGGTRQALVDQLTEYERRTIIAFSEAIGTLSVCGYAPVTVLQRHREHFRQSHVRIQAFQITR